MNFKSNKILIMKSVSSLVLLKTSDDELTSPCGIALVLPLYCDVL